MSFIQKIRDKYARIAVIAIALALLGFILTDYLSTRGGNIFGGDPSTTLGSINGKKITFIDFETKVKAMEARQQAQGSPLNEASRQQLIQNVWNQEVNQIIMNDEFEKLGFVVGAKEINDYLFGSNPPPDLKQQFTDPQTGQYNAALAQQAINRVKRSPNKDEQLQFIEYVNALTFERMTQKYNSLLSNAVYYPKWFIEKQNTENSGLAKISYVKYPYDRIPDSTVKVSDKEIEDYIKKNKDLYKQVESRSIVYLVFDAAPTPADSAANRSQLESLKQEFATTEDAAAFLARHGSSSQFFDSYVSKSQMQMPFKDSIQALAKNQIFGPYQDNNSYALAKMLDAKLFPDSVKAKHILIQTTDPQQGTQLLDDSTAKKKIDSIEISINNGASFDSLASQFSDDNKGPDGGSAAKGGDLGYFPYGQMVKEFNDFCFEGKTGDRKVLKTAYGYHLVEITDQKSPVMHYKVAYMSKPITASQETEDNANNAANSFAGSNRDLKSFNANADSLKISGINKFFASNITPDAYTVDGIAGEARQLVRAVYEADKGEVIEPKRIGDKYIVAAVTEVYEEGTMHVDAGRSSVEPVLRNKKKAEIIKKKIPKVTTLEDASSKLGFNIETVDSVRFSGSPQLGYEYKIIGAAINPANTGKVITEPIEGSTGVYILRIDNLTATPVEAANIEDQRKALQAQARQAALYNQPGQVLRLAATIKDYRRNFY